METENLYTQPDENSQGPETEPPSFTDKLIGIFASPSATFSTIAKFPPKVTDWIIPLIIVISVAIISIILINSNPDIKHEMTEIQMSTIEDHLVEAVESGGMTQEQADQQFEKVADMMESSGNSVYIWQIIGVVFSTFIIFIIISGIFFLFAKFALKGDGDYVASLVAYGLPQYIIALQIIVIIIASLFLNKLIIGTSLATVLGIEPNDFTGFILSKIDPFRIWFYAVISIGYSKMFKSDNTAKYFIMIFGLWIGFGVAVFIASQYVPALRWLAVY